MRLKTRSHAEFTGVTALRGVDHIRQAAWTGLYWTCSAEPDGSWILHQFNTNTGTFTEPRATSPRFTGDLPDVTGWMLSVLDLRDLAGWTDWQDGPTFRYIESTYTLVRDLTRRRPGRDLEIVVDGYPEDPTVPRVVIREYWRSNGQTSPPLADYSRDYFGDDADMLGRVSELYDLDPDTWTEITPGTHYRHP
jgi:hypothetical protein